MRIATGLRIVRNNRTFIAALNLIASSGIVSIFGFLFWIVIAQRYTSSEVGVATTLISSALLIALLSQAGFDTTFIRFLPKSKRKNQHINTGLVISGLTSIALAGAYCLVVPLFFPSMSILSTSPIYALGFMLFALFATWNILTNAALIAYRKTKFILIIDTVFSLVKISLPFLITSGGAMAIFMVVGIAQVVNVALSIFVLIRYFGYRPILSVDKSIIKETKRYSAGVYTSSVLNLLPDSLLPLIVINQLGASEAAYFYITFAIANLVYTIAFAITQVLLAETANDEERFSEHARHGIKISLALLTPAIALVVALAPYILNIFGESYAAGGTQMLRIMALSGFFVMGYSFLSFYFKHTKKLVPLIIMTAVNAATILGLSVPLAHIHGLVGIGLAWLLGTIIALAAGIICYLIVRGKNGHTDKVTNARHAEAQKTYRRMKILRIVSAGYEQGGAENGIVLTNQVLKRRGHLVKVLSSDIGYEHEHFSDFEFLSIPDSGMRKLIYTVFNVDAYKKTKKVVAEFEPDIVLLHTMHQATASVLFALRKYHTIQFIHGPEVFIHQLLPWCLARKDYKNGYYDKDDLTLLGKLHYIYYKFICGAAYRLGLRYIDQFVALSSYTENMLKKERFLPVTFVRNGARILKFSDSFPAQPTLLYAGRLEKFKGVEDLIRAMPVIARQLPGIKLNIAGEGSFDGSLRHLTRELGLEQSVAFLGHLNKREISRQYRTCSVVVLPSIWPETFGKVGIEAMSAGRPVIASKVGGVCDWLVDGENGFLVDPNSPNQIAEKCMRLLTNETLLKHMGRNARATAEKFSIKSLANNIEQVCLGITEVKSPKA